MTVTHTTRSRPALLGLAALVLLLSTLVCAGAGAGLLPGTLSQVPRWACPTPTPLPYGEDGPVKSVDVFTGDDGQVVTHTVYFDKWEQEYGDLDDPAPTPYTRSGMVFSLRQLVNLSDALDLQVDAQAGPLQTDGRQFYTIQTVWTNRGQPVPLQPARQIVLSAVLPASGAVRLGPWQASDEVLRVAGLLTSTTVISASLPRGTTTITVPVLAPAGAVQSVAIKFDPPGSTQVGSAGSTALQFSAGRGHPPVGPGHRDPAGPALGRAVSHRPACDPAGASLGHHPGQAPAEPPAPARAARRELVLSLAAQGRPPTTCRQGLVDLGEGPGHAGEPPASRAGPPLPRASCWSTTCRSLRPWST